VIYLLEFDSSHNLLSSLLLSEMLSYSYHHHKKHSPCVGEIVSLFEKLGSDAGVALALS